MLPEQSTLTVKCECNMYIQYVYVIYNMGTVVQLNKGREACTVGQLTFLLFYSVEDLINAELTVQQKKYSLAHMIEKNEIRV